MAGSVNKVILIGFCGKDAEIRTSQSGSRFANFTIATSESWRDKATGERKERSEWHNISVTNDALVGIVERYVSKGSKVYVEGQLQTRKWQDKEGNDRYSTEVVLKPFNGSIVLLDSKEKDAPQSADRYEASVKAQSPDAFAEDFEDSEIPF